jgi:hypothetical protein
MLKGQERRVIRNVGRSGTWSGTLDRMKRLKIHASKTKDQSILTIKPKHLGIDSD